LSKELGITNKELIDVAKSIGITVKSHASSIEDEEVLKIKDKVTDKNNGTTQTDISDQVPNKEIKEKVTVFKSESGQEVVERRKGRRVVLRKKKITESEVLTDEIQDVEPGTLSDDQVVESEKEGAKQLELDKVEAESESKDDNIALKIDDQDLKKAVSKDTGDQHSREVEELSKEEELTKQLKVKEKGKELKPSDDQIESDDIEKEAKRIKKKGKVIKPKREEIIDEDTLEELRRAFRTKLPVRKKEFLIDNRRTKSRFHGDHNKQNRFTSKFSQAVAENKYHEETGSPSIEEDGLQPKPSKRTVKIPEAINVAELAKKMSVKAVDVIKKLLSLGVKSTINESIDNETASIVAEEFGFDVESDIFEEDKHLLVQDANGESKPVPRYPVVTVMGHVDHGKTTLLDTIRKTKVVEGEAGGITQHIGAYSVNVNDRKVTFIDTPGHEAFTAMRARGAKITDVVIIVVAADDGIMPQTVEAINHAKAADVPIIVAINKIDKPEADIDMVKRQLGDIGLVPEVWGGDTLFAEISAKTGAGIDNLLELVLLQADILELKANPEMRANGIVVESKLDKGRGPVATVIIKEGTLNIGDFIVSGVNQCRVRALIDDKGKNIDFAGPSTPAEIMGFSSVPEAGDTFYVVKDEKTLKDVLAHRENKARSKLAATEKKISLETFFSTMEEGESKELPLILKADTQGSIEAIKDSIDKLGTEKCTVKIVHSGVGSISESDVVLASASNAIIFGFNVRPDAKALSMAERESVDIELHTIIYNALDRIKNAMEGLLEPIKKENIIGHAEVREVFHISKIGTIAGCYITDGKVNRNSNIRVVRDGITAYQGLIDSLKRFKDDVREVQSGYECGISVKNFNDIKVGDVLELYEIEEHRQTL